MLSRDKPDRCPCCGQAYKFRVPARYSHTMNLQMSYRCGRRGGYVYVHRIDVNPLAAPG